MLNITAFNTYSETKLYLPCPRCEKNYEIGLLAFLSAVNRHDSVTCVDCKTDFFIEVLCLTRAAELLRAPAQSELKCPTCEVGKLEKGFQCDYCFQVFDEADISERSDGG